MVDPLKNLGLIKKIKMHPKYSKMATINKSEKYEQPLKDQQGMFKVTTHNKTK